MNSKRITFVLISALAVLSMLATQCQPETIVETVVVEKTEETIENPTH